MRFASTGNDGDLDVGTSSGELHIGDVHGSATVKSSNGNIELGHITGSLKVRAANGRIDIARVDRSVVSKTSNGATRIGQVGEGDVLLTAAAAGLQIGIPEGTTAWLDLHSQFGRVRNELETAAAPSGAVTTGEGHRQDLQRRRHRAPRRRRTLTAERCPGGEPDVAVDQGPGRSTSRFERPTRDVWRSTRPVRPSSVAR